MKRRFVIGIQGMTEAQEKSFRDFLNKHGFWWHWIDNLWLFATNKPALTASEIRDAAPESARTIVLEFPEDITWATRGKPNTQGKKMSDWLESTWKKDD